MSLEQWLQLAQIVVLVASVAVNVFLFVRARDDARFESVEKHLGDTDTARRATDTEIATIRTHVAVHEARLASIPTHTDMMGIRVELTSVRTELSAVSERSETTLDAVQSLQQYLLEARR